MSRLFVKVSTGYFVHRKTMRLCALLGESASNLPIRLWIYAAENQTDGDFSDYSEEEIARVIGFTGDASSMLQALQKAGFMDERQIHDWENHNAYHATYTKRARTAAVARWKKEKKQKKEEYKEIEKEREREKEQAMLEKSQALLQASGANISPPTIKDVVVAGENFGCPKDVSERFYHHYESNGWTDGNGRELKKWQHKLAEWKSNEQAKEREAKLRRLKYTQTDPSQERRDREYEEARKKYG